MNDFERQWAVALKKSQQQTKHNKNVPIDVWKKQVTEEMDYFKAEIKKYIRVKNESKIKEILKKLFKLRAEQIEIFNQEMLEKFGFADENKLEKEIKKYYLDCKKILQATKSLLNR